MEGETQEKWPSMASTRHRPTCGQTAWYNPIEFQRRGPRAVVEQRNPVTSSETE
jgi:hypothetical protein